MPLLATLVAACINGLISFFGLWMAAGTAIKVARRVFVIALMAAFLVAVKVCMTSLLGMVAGVSGLPHKFLVGLGMFIPSNAGAVIACVGSVWLACVVVRLKRDGLGW